MHLALVRVGLLRLGTGLEVYVAGVKVDNFVRWACGLGVDRIFGVGSRARIAGFN